MVSERQLDEMGALSGAGPGYVFVIIDALADAGVRAGLPRKLAVEAAAQTLYGAAKMVLETGKHPAELRDGVTSPGGTTIAGIHAMEARASVLLSWTPSWRLLRNLMKWAENNERQRKNSTAYFPSTGEEAYFENANISEVFCKGSKSRGL